MSEGMYEPRGRYFEEYEIGQTIATTGRTITEGDIVLIPAGEKHWHGAVEDADFSHIYFFRKGFYSF